MNYPGRKRSPLTRNEKHRLDLLIIFHKTAKAKKLLNKHKGMLWDPNECIGPRVSIFNKEVALSLPNFLSLFA